MMLAVLAVLTIQGPSPNDSGAAIFRNSCRMCHGANGRGDSTMIARLGVRPANLARCSESTAEPEGRWAYQTGSMQRLALANLRTTPATWWVCSPILPHFLPNSKQWFRTSSPPPTE